MHNSDLSAYYAVIYTHGKIYQYIKVICSTYVLQNICTARQNLFTCAVSCYQIYIITNGLPMRDNIGSQGMDFAHFSLGKPREKSAKSIQRVPMLSLIGNHKILYFSHHTELYYNEICNTHSLSLPPCLWEMAWSIHTPISQKKSTQARPM